MKVILVQNVGNLGQTGDLKEVKAGYARNFLFTKGLAVLPDDPKAQELQKIHQRKSIQKEDLSNKIEQLEGRELVFTVKVNKKDIPFKAIHAKEIAEKLGVKEETIDVKSIKAIGKHLVFVKSGNKLAKINIVVNPEK